MIYLIIPIYLLGGFVAYLIMKKSVKQQFGGQWSSGDRAFSLCISSLSWVGALCALVVWLCSNDKPAKW